MLFSASGLCGKVLVAVGRAIEELQGGSCEKTPEAAFMLDRGIRGPLIPQRTPIYFTTRSLVSVAGICF